MFWISMFFSKALKQGTNCIWQACLLCLTVQCNWQLGAEAWVQIQPLSCHSYQTLATFSEYLSHLPCLLSEDNKKYLHIRIMKRLNGLIPTKLLENSLAWPAFSAREAVSPAGYGFHLVPLLSFIKLCLFLDSLLSTVITNFFLMLFQK